MDNAIKELQREVYKLDWRIADCSQDLLKDLDNDGSFTARGDLELYNKFIAKRAEITVCIEKLKALA